MELPSLHHRTFPTQYPGKEQQRVVVLTDHEPRSQPPIARPQSRVHSFCDHSCYGHDGHDASAEDGKDATNGPGVGDIANEVAIQRIIGMGDGSHDNLAQVMDDSSVLDYEVWAGVED